MTTSELLLGIILIQILVFVGYMLGKKNADGTHIIDEYVKMIFESKLDPRVVDICHDMISHPEHWAGNVTISNGVYTIWAANSWYFREIWVGDEREDENLLKPKFTNDEMRLIDYAVKVVKRRNKLLETRFDEIYNL